ncbi:putative gliotoxin efflux pump [Mollisia scopiformis]|uniref:Putative gliotoxin efflux pump n=1 Tax=Mollisia scopiformis TaxID=149040 RepID=A0A194WUW5_MOLSC|nr:putative gliotoxin efflux pump [Mollisia scopiformis]KUJ11454.1 putative gliotoxin efflux pump [Mollisia scopiformis]
MSISADAEKSQNEKSETPRQIGTPEDILGNDDAITEEAATLAGWKLLAISFSVILSIFLASLDLTIVATVISYLTSEFYALDDVAWYSSVLLLTVATTQGIWGKAFKYFDIKLIYLLSIFTFELGSLVCAVAPNSSTFIAGRAITGLGAAGTFSGSYIVIGVSAPAKQRPALTGLFFYINLPCGGVAAAFVLMFLRIPSNIKVTGVSFKEKVLQMDFPGVALSIGAMLCYMFALQWGGTTKPWVSADVVGTLVGFVVLALAFIIREYYQGDRAFLPRSVLKNRMIVLVALYCFFLAGVFYIFLFLLPVYFQAVKGTDVIESGIRQVPLILSITLLQIIVGTVISVTSHFNIFIILSRILSTVASGLWISVSADAGHSVWIGYQVLAGIGIGAGLTVPIIVTQAIMDPQDIALATAVVIFGQSTGGTIILPAATSIFQNILLKTLSRTAPSIPAAQIVAVGATNLQSKFTAAQLPGIRAAYIKGLHDAFILSAALSAMSLILACCFPWRNLRKKKEVEDTNGVNERRSAINDSPAKEA